MNKKELAKQLLSMGISPHEYSLEGSIATWDTIVLVEDYSMWKVLYIDEHGNQMNLRPLKQRTMRASLFIMNLDK